MPKEIGLGQIKDRKINIPDEFIVRSCRVTEINSKDGDYGEYWVIVIKSGAATSQFILNDPPAFRENDIIDIQGCGVVKGKYRNLKVDQVKLSKPPAYDDPQDNVKPPRQETRQPEARQPEDGLTAARIMTRLHIYQKIMTNLESFHQNMPVSLDTAAAIAGAWATSEMITLEKEGHDFRQEPRLDMDKSAESGAAHPLDTDTPPDKAVDNDDVPF